MDIEPTSIFILAIKSMITGNTLYAIPVVSATTGSANLASGATPQDALNNYWTANQKYWYVSSRMTDAHYDILYGKYEVLEVIATLDPEETVAPEVIEEETEAEEGGEEAPSEEEEADWLKGAVEWLRGGAQAVLKPIVEFIYPPEDEE